MKIVKRLCALPLSLQILFAIVLAFAVGAVTNPQTALLGLRLFDVLDFFGTLFLNALKMVVVPLVVASIISGVSNLGSGKELGRLGIKTITYYASTSLMAILLGLFLVNMIQPGIVNGVPIKALSMGSNLSSVIESAKTHQVSDILSVFMDLIPPNIVSAATQGQMLGLITFSILFGYCINLLAKEEKNVMRGFWRGMFQVMMNITEMVMKLAPFGIFALVTEAVMSTGLSLLMPLLTFFFTVLSALLIHSLFTVSLLLYFIGRVNPLAHLKAMFPALITAFSTASSAATLPITMECVERESGVSNKISSFILPLGATVNMDGTALYECVAAMFIAQAYGIELSVATQFTVVLLALLTSVGVAGIPSASLVAITLILSATGVPLEGIGLLLVTDRLLDMFRTSANIYSDSCSAVVVARTEGEQTNIALK